MSQNTRKRKLVLLIEDDQGIRTMVAEVCRNEGYEVGLRYPVSLALHPTYIYRVCNVF